MKTNKDTTYILLDKECEEDRELYKELRTVMYDLGHKTLVDKNLIKKYPKLWELIKKLEDEIRSQDQQNEYYED